MPDRAIAVGERVVELDGAAEVEEPHPGRLAPLPIARRDQVVAGVGIGVEEAVAERRAPREAHDRQRDLGVQRAIAAWQLGQRQPRRALHGQHPPRRPRAVDPRDRDHRIAGPRGGGALERVGLGAVVELADDRGADHRQRRRRQRGPQRQAGQPAHEAVAGDVGGQRLGDVGVLHLHRQRATVGVGGGVDLPQRRGGDRHRIPGREQALGRRAQLGLDHLRDRGAGGGRRRVPQRAQLVGRAATGVRDQLRDLGHPALQLAGVPRQLALGGGVDDAIVVVGVGGIGGDDLLGPRPHPGQADPGVGPQPSAQPRARVVAHVTPSWRARWATSAA